MKNREIYQNPLIDRYSSKEMMRVFSPDNKFRTWRKLWIALAESQMELGLAITDEQIEELKENQFNINYDVAIKREKETRHDVMSHVFAYGEQCPKAKGIIHLGATSCYVGDNTDIIVMKDALEIIKVKMLNLFNVMSKFCDKYKNLPTLGFTHFQPAQLTTVGKRASLWLHDLFMDYENLEYQFSKMKLRGVKGTTGTQASFLNLFDNDSTKVYELEEKIAKKIGLDSTFPVTGQTYSRKLDYEILSLLSGIAQSLHKMTNDIRLLQNLKEIEEPFEKNQIGSSAMAYKRNPMRSERIASLARHVIANSQNAAMTSSSQWFERTLDDSANRRIALPEAFLATDAILSIAINIFDGMIVYEKMIQKHIEAELPFMATENIIMQAVKNGGDRQELHERIRMHSMETAKVVKIEGKPNDLIERIVNDKSFMLTINQVKQLMEAKNYIGLAPEQVNNFLNEYICPILEENKSLLDIEVTLRV